MALSLPAPLREPLRSVLALSEEDVDRLCDALSDGSLASPRDLVGAATRSVDTDVALDELVRAVVSVHVARFAQDWSAGEIARDLAASEQLELTDADESTFVNRVERLLSVMGPDGVAKSIDLQTDHARILWDSRIVTELRPVFSDLPADGVRGMVMSHTLRLLYQQDGGSQTFYVSLDSTDLEALAAEIKRALEKVESIKQHLGDKQTLLYSPEAQP